MTDMELAKKLAKDLDLGDEGFVYFYLMELVEEFQDKYPGHRILCIPGMNDLAVLPNGSTDLPFNVFKEDYPACRQLVLIGGGCGG